MALPRSKPVRPVKRGSAKPLPDQRIWGRNYRGPAPWLVGLFVTLLIACGVYLAFAKELPWADEGYQLNATFENAATLRPSSPVRVAGVNVGEVASIDADGELTRVTFSLDDEALPVKEDAEVVIRPRLFLEGNFFLDLRTGSPAAPELPDDGTIPASQTATAVQIDEVLTALQAPTRRALQRALHGFATGLNYQPTAADDAGHDPESAGKTGAEALQASLRYGGPAGRDTSIVNEALLGESPHDLSGMIRAQRAVFAQLDGREAALQGLITNFNVTAGAFAAEAENLSRSIAVLEPTLETAEPALANLSAALPPVRALALELEPSLRQLPATIDAANPWLDQARPLLSSKELGGLARMLEVATPSLAQVPGDSHTLFDQTTSFGRCVSENLVPTGDVVIDDNGGAYPFGEGAPGYPSGVSNYQDFLSSLVNLAGAGQGFDGNGSYLRVNSGGGGVLGATPYPSGGFRNTTVFGNNQAAVTGGRPSFTAATPPYRPDVNCSKNELPDVNGVGGDGFPGDVEAPNPEALP
jgi:phospholipid/cholesterol/gamma-HCH transport system substrate-binding protein